MKKFIFKSKKTRNKEAQLKGLSYQGLILMTLLKDHGKMLLENLINKEKKGAKKYSSYQDHLKQIKDQITRSMLVIEKLPLTLEEREQFELCRQQEVLAHSSTCIVEITTQLNVFVFRYSKALYLLSFPKSARSKS